MKICDKTGKKVRNDFFYLKFGECFLNNVTGLMLNFVKKMGKVLRKKSSLKSFMDRPLIKTAQNIFQNVIRNFSRNKINVNKQEQMLIINCRKIFSQFF